ncbi:transcriptional regulator [Spirosoma sp. HMF4905]|uniref:Transcriptional regulator n=1 Tax=Spirosoma arboris TaxID=2682092 RepID=A0A7K1SPB5_9BACT|nr:helix-turn-helix domain-containing protein [Spirosoma arboris]MVM35645.1 transcriptional regulator [Spirosoma arboris]
MIKTECISPSVSLVGRLYPCTVSLAMNLVGGKWKAVILYHLTDMEKRYSELKRAMPDVTEMTLSIQLKQLEKDNFIVRKVYGEKPPIRVEYSLTDFGKTFIPVLEAITAWGNQVVEEKGEFVNGV